MRKPEEVASELCLYYSDDTMVPTCTIAEWFRNDRIALLDEIEARCPRMLIETANSLQDLRREMKEQAK